MSSEEENIQAREKCGYCGYLIKNMNNILEHTCFKEYDEESQRLFIDDNHSVTVVSGEVILKTKGNDDVWNKDLDEALITAVSQRPPLYNYRLPLKNRTSLKIADLWKEISNLLGVSAVHKIQRRWEFLRRTYIEAKAKERVYKPSGSAAPSKKVQKRFELFEMMTFLDDLCKPMKTISSLTSDSESDEEDVENNGRKNCRDVHTIQLYEKVIECISPPTNTSSFNPITSLLLSLGPSLRKLGTHRQSRVRKQFLQILEEELLDQEESG